MSGLESHFACGSVCVGNLATTDWPHAIQEKLL